MNIRTAELQKEIEWAIAHGWIPYYESAASIYGLHIFDVADYMAITSRETNFNPKYLTVPGDGGHGYGPMQADSRSGFNASFIHTGEWKKPDKAIVMGAYSLAFAYNEVLHHEGRRLEVEDSASKRKFFVDPAKKLTPNERYFVTLAAYNCGLWSLYQISKGRPIDASTTGKDYASDVSQRAIMIRTLLARREATVLTRKP